MSQKEANLFQLRDRFANTGAENAFDEMRLQTREHGRFQLKRLLRHHEEEPISEQKEIDMRDDFDYLLAYYGLVEIAALVELVPDPLPQETQKSAATILSNKYVQRYYAKYYELLLPQMLLARIAGENTLKEKEGAIPIFGEFLQISAQRNEMAVDTLLWFLDNGYNGTHGWESTEKILSNPEKTLEALKTPYEKANDSQRAVSGFGKFINFSVAFHELLERTENFPLLQSAMWHYHGYWFDKLGSRLRNRFERVLDHFGEWSKRSTPLKQYGELSEEDLRNLNQEAECSRNKVKGVLEELTSEKFGKLLKEKASSFSISRSWQQNPASWKSKPSPLVVGLLQAKSMGTIGGAVQVGGIMRDVFKNSDTDDESGSSGQMA